MSNSSRVFGSIRLSKRRFHFAVESPSAVRFPTTLSTTGTVYSKLLLRRPADRRWFGSGSEGSFSEPRVRCKRGGEGNTHGEQTQGTTRGRGGGRGGGQESRRQRERDNNITVINISRL